LSALEPFRDQLVVIGGLSVAKNAGDTVHARARTRFRPGGPPKEDIADPAAHELALDANDFAGACDGGYSCTYTSTISWRGPTTPLPMEYNPRVVFERLFGDGGTTDAAARPARREENGSILDSVNAGIARLARDLGPADRSKLQEYLEAVRDVERRIQKAE